MRGRPQSLAVLAIHNQHGNNQFAPICTYTEWLHRSGEQTNRDRQQARDAANEMKRGGNRELMELEVAA
jgi:hypothetical protein